MCVYIKVKQKLNERIKNKALPKKNHDNDLIIIIFFLCIIIYPCIVYINYSHSINLI